MNRVKKSLMVVGILLTNNLFSGHVCKEVNSGFDGSDFKPLCIKPYFENEENNPVHNTQLSKNDLKKNLVLYGSATTKEGIDYLYWSMCPERDNFFFEIQRLYKNKWEFVSGVGSKENTTEITYYDIPVNHQHGINKYRLKQIDKNGRFSFSETLEVDWTGEKMNISNQPIYKDSDSKILVVLSDDEGNMVAFKTIIKYENGNLIAMYKPHTISTGNYHIIGSSTNMFDGSTLVLR